MGCIALFERVLLLLVLTEEFIVLVVLESLVRFLLALLAYNSVC